MKYKPSWEDAPEWANYLTQNYDGSWVWWEKEPYKSKETYAWSGGGKNSDVVVINHWKKTIEKRTCVSKEQVRKRLIDLTNETNNLKKIYNLTKFDKQFIDY